ncbi:MAG TPA: hypothetical protein VHV82_16290 [Sporichthyaceae bacterium]|nr:hypothetical protein [Sporichthyaceae bacterium]
MSRIRIAGLALAALSLLAPTAAVAGPVAPGAAAPPSAPPSASNCGQIQLAPVLATDQTDDGKPIVPQPDRRGVYVPIIMVPDWSGQATHDDSRTGDFSAPIDMSASGAPPAAPRASLIGLLQQIPGAAVYTFDYRKSAGRWVDDPGIGPALGDAIDCLTGDLGQKAILLTHGLGGIAARYAVAGNVPGHDRGAEVTNVIGYGSPQLGLQLADLLNTGVGTTASEPRTMLRLLLGACAGLPATQFDPKAPCGFLPAEAKSLAAGGGEAYQATSEQQIGLLPYPVGVTLDSFAGDVTVKAPTLGWFNAHPFRTDAITMGDLVASTASVTVSARSQLRAACAVSLDAYGMPNQSVGLHLTQQNAPDAGATWSATAQPCYAPDLTRVSDFADSISSIITKEIRNRQPLLSTEVQSLPVPALCGHPAGKLVGGYLPGIDPTEGYVALAASLDPSRTKDYIVYGDINNDGVPDTVVVLKCADANGPGADVVAAYDSQGSALGVISLDQITKQPRNEIYKVNVVKEEGRIEWRTTRPTDAACCPTVDAYATFNYDPTTGGLKAGTLQSYNETTPAGQLMDFARTGNTGKAAQALAAPDILNQMIAANRDTAAFESLTCYGPTPPDTSWPAAASAEFGRPWPPNDGRPHGDRFCLIKLADVGAAQASANPLPPGTTAPPEPERYALLGMAHTGFKTWRAVEFRMPGASGPINSQPGAPGPGDGNPGVGGGLFGPGGPLGRITPAGTDD